MILFWDTALWKWQRGAVDLISCGVYSLILRVISPYIQHPALSGLFLHLFRFIFSVPLLQALGSILFPGQEGLFSGAAPLCAVLYLRWLGERDSGVGKRRIEPSVEAAQNIPK